MRDEHTQVANERRLGSPAPYRDSERNFDVDFDRLFSLDMDGIQLLQNTDFGAFPLRTLQSKTKFFESLKSSLTRSSSFLSTLHLTNPGAAVEDSRAL
jgi:hypothetical protein